MSLERQITIEWNYKEKQDSIHNWYKWQPTEELKLHTLEKKLSWPEGTIHILESAFRLELGRKTGWDLNAIPQWQRAAYLTAAQVFKRGVMVKTLATSAQSGNYTIDITNEASPPINNVSENIYLVDKNVANAHHISENQQIKVFFIEEKDKTLRSVADLLAFIDTTKEEKNFVVVGGGVLCDVAAFALSLRKKSFILMPTTLLAMVDASVGGKTGVNFPPYGKNQIGLFSFPSKVIIWPKWLKTLSKKHIRAGHAECFKHALLSGDKNLIDTLSNKLKLTQYHDLMPALIDVKAKIIREDPNEKGKRAVLNLGHTLAHALEKISHEQSKTTITHGEAVGVGLGFALKLSKRIAKLDETLYAELIIGLQKADCLLKRHELEVYLNEQNLTNKKLIEKLVRAMRQDKKNENNQIKWVLLEQPGSMRMEGNSYTVKVDQAILSDVWLDYVQDLKA